jgi:hypothetical protein
MPSGVKLPRADSWASKLIANSSPSLFILSLLFRAAAAGDGVYNLDLFAVLSKGYTAEVDDAFIAGAGPLGIGEPALRHRDIEKLLAVAPKYGVEILPPSEQQ